MDGVAFMRWGDGFMRQLFSVLIAIVLFVSQAQASTIQTLELGKIYVVLVNGEIGQGDAAKFRSNLQNAAKLASKNNKGIIVGLNSSGGLIGEALEMGNFIKQYELPISVLGSSECLSACFLMFLASPKKLLVHGARIGVHSAANVQGAETDSTKATTVDFARIAKENGAPNSVVGKLVAAKPDEMFFLSEEEMKQMGAVFTDDEAGPKPYAAPNPQVAGSVSSMPPAQSMPSAGNFPTNDQAPTESREEQDAAFAKYWGQKIKLSKAQHSGRPAAEKRCNKNSCAIIVAYYDKAQRYIEIWKYDEPPKGDGRKLVCRQDRYEGQLTCTDWYDGHTFVINLDHYIGANLSDPVEDFLRLFD